MIGSGLRSNGTMRSLAGRAVLVVHPEPSFSPCLPLYCERAAAPSAGGPAAAERDVLDRSCGSDLKLDSAECFGLFSALCCLALQCFFSVLFFLHTQKLQRILHGEFSIPSLFPVSFFQLLTLSKISTLYFDSG